MSAHHVAYQRQRLEPARGEGSGAVPNQYTATLETNAEDYDQWLHAKVQKAMDSTHPRLPHPEAMARVDRLLQERRRQRAAG